MPVELNARLGWLLRAEGRADTVTIMTNRRPRREHRDQPPQGPSGIHGPRAATCLKCNAKNTKNSTYCDSCDERLAPFCRRCKTVSPSHFADGCDRCGKIFK